MGLPLHSLLVFNAKNKQLTSIWKVTEHRLVPSAYKAAVPHANGHHSMTGACQQNTLMVHAGCQDCGECLPGVISYC